MVSSEVSNEVTLNSKVSFKNSSKYTFKWKDVLIKRGRFATKHYREDEESKISFFVSFIFIYTL